ncbi:Petal formation-expressed [Macleaya cordata]|uniref:Petal formation-expressed n=1 Tax=Macleaya cordata TaxID=56857 RepID=A0A200QH91_MACCD|nr:Petal formation-expressed [Macleaya cordata]
MATITQAMSLRQLRSPYYSTTSRSSTTKLPAKVLAPKFPVLACVSSLPKTHIINSTSTPEELIIKSNNFGYKTTTTASCNSSSNFEGNSAASMAASELYAIAEVVGDRAEMHANIGEQRNNWNNLLLTSINSITLTASMMAGLSSITSSAGTPILALKLSSALLYSAATAMLLVVNKIQPSQLAEEQRNAARLFKQLHEKIKSTLALHTSPTTRDVKDTMERVLAIDKAYPLPLLGGVMLNKFPKSIEPAIWWPRLELQQGFDEKRETNGWSGELEEEMRELVGVLKRKDSSEYVRLSKLVLKLNKTLSILGPLLTGFAALGSILVGSNFCGPWAMVVAVVGGALASVVNTLEHGGQVGMVFEMYRNCAGFYRFVEDSIESSLEERDLEKRENGELFEIKVALELGRSVSELRNLASTSSSKDGEFAGKLF